ncbi:cyclohexanone monooxygenase [Novosphingobium sp. CF614]|uniref:flavin-containing monooxygenase n=1 Tax=Novosphingobium sp. CF614 TaxID=1884364 RepID=UPI0008EF1060|nr:NAD(P)/FAD-dependent oxidoreductase [Novosphingobium sp. CF614]SFG01011.1 cyclohexanone monooxygenase [Novosphingobium sp. CF614]
MAENTTPFNFDSAALRKKYDYERDKRLNLRPEGEAQFFRMRGSQFEGRLQDPYTEYQERDARSEDVEVAIIGGGFAGLLAAARLIEQGIDDIRIFERGGDFGGTWYWNRYPGAACDVESYIYLPLLEEVGTMPSARYIFAPEILEHCRAIARKYDLYSRALLHTSINEARLDEASSRWIIKSDRGDEIRARFVILASGHYREPKLPGIPGIETFKQHSFHTSRWDYDYTGGSPYEPMEKLKDKVVGIIGTGATAVQCIPHLAKTAKHLFVFQRTPSSIDVRDNRPTDPEWYNSLKPGWHQERMRNFVLAVRGMTPVDLIQDGWTKFGKLIMQNVRPDMAEKQIEELMQLIDFRMMEDIRARIDTIITDRDTAEALKPWYNWLCKRPCYHDEYLDVFNQPNVTLVDTDGKGVERISEDAVFANGQEYKVDCLVFATGFELSPYEKGTPIPVIGRGDRTLEDKWEHGASTLHGIHVHDFPNFMLSGTRQGSWENNFPFAQEVVATHIAAIIRKAMDRGADTVEVTADAEQEWVNIHRQRSQRNLAMWRDCTPSYFNQEGRADERVILNGTFGGSALEFEEILIQWRADGLPGLVMAEKEA